MWNESGLFENTDVILILDCYFGPAAICGLEEKDRSVEIIAAVGMDQKAFGNASTNARFQQRTFTSRLADEVAQVLGNVDNATISFAETIGRMRATSQPERLPEYSLKLGHIGIRLSIPDTSRTRSPGSASRHSKSSSSGSAVSASPLMAVFKVHLEGTTSSSVEVQKFVDWIYSLDPNIGLELNGVFKTRSIDLIFHAPWHIWASLNGLSGFDLVCETYRRNRLSYFQQRTAPPRQSQVRLENVR